MDVICVVRIYLADHHISVECLTAVELLTYWDEAEQFNLSLFASVAYHAVKGASTTRLYLGFGAVGEVDGEIHRDFYSAVRRDANITRHCEVIADTASLCFYWQ